MHRPHRKNFFGYPFRNRDKASSDARRLGKAALLSLDHARDEIAENYQIIEAQAVILETHYNSRWYKIGRFFGWIHDMRVVTLADFERELRRES